MSFFVSALTAQMTIVQSFLKHSSSTVVTHIVPSDSRQIVPKISEDQTSRSIREGHCDYKAHGACV